MQTQDKYTKVKLKEPGFIKLRYIGNSLGFVFSMMIVVLVGIDTIANNWAINDFMGDGHRFITPVASVSTAADLSSQYSFDVNRAMDDLSRIGIWMLNYTVQAMTNPNSNVYILSAGTYPMPTQSSLDLCSIFEATYPLDLNKTSVARLALADNYLMYVRGDALSHAFTDDTTTNLATSTMKSTDLKSTGYTPVRLNVDARFTEDIEIVNTPSAQTHIVNFYRLWPKSFCTGCVIFTELGFGQCNMTFLYNDNTKHITISKSKNNPGSQYNMGLLLPHSTFSSASIYVKFIAIFFAVGGFLASRRTVQWKEADLSKTESHFAALTRTVLPKFFPYPSHAFRFDMFCYNSDLFVFLFTIGILLDMQYGLLYLKTSNMYNSLSPQFTYSLQIYGITTRLLWVNCAALKFFKLIWNALSSASYCGESRVMGFLNLSSVTTMYLSAILLFYIPPYITYNNSVVAYLNNKLERLDSIHVNVLESYYLRCIPAVAVGAIINLFVVIVVDHTWNYRTFRLISKNSLGRQALYNSTSILCDFIQDIEVDTEGDGTTTLIHCKARRLGTLQWFFMCHLFSFGLPEKEIRGKKKAHTKIVGGQNVSTTHTASTVVNEDTTISSGKYMVAQDGDHHMHLIDDNLNDVTALVYNIKVLKDLPFAIQ
ncbi:hypothetical protein THRCLA_06414 [Thraustotheca clavata]|uniref:Transmembrane protein n=1 Tax=Thraustotheca clavata TaxID=74557 RepID=A0A1V9ZPJ3_9STRA|nr:hypothetical protein THRCLA_06414 [Thraustotheca clavata]